MYGHSNVFKNNPYSWKKMKLKKKSVQKDYFWKEAENIIFLSGKWSVGLSDLLF